MVWPSVHVAIHPTEEAITRPADLALALKAISAGMHALGHPITERAIRTRSLARQTSESGVLQESMVALAVIRPGRINAMRIVATNRLATGAFINVVARLLAEIAIQRSKVAARCMMARIAARTGFTAEARRRVVAPDESITWVMEVTL